MNAEDEKWTQQALMEYGKKHCISKVLSIDWDDAVPKGTNYGSDMLRLNVKTVLYSGDIVNKSVIYKKMPQTPFRQNLFKSANIFGKESKLYAEVLPQMEGLRQQKTPGVERFSAVCFGVKKDYKGLLLEDLTESGYKLADRLTGLDFKHAEVAINGLAEFHALSLVLIERGDLNPENYKEELFYNNPGIRESMISSAIPELIRTIEEEWRGEWLSYIGKLKEFLETAISRLIDEVKFSNSDFNVLLHGDYWLTNMMFRYNSDGEPLNNRLLDFQLPHYSKALYDVTYFLYTSLNADSLMKKDELIQIYYESLRRYLILYEFSGKTPSLEDILEDFKKLKIFSLFMGLAVKPFMMQPVKEIIDDKEEWMKGLTDKGMKPPNLRLEEIERTLKIILKYGREIGVF